MPRTACQAPREPAPCRGLIARAVAGGALILWAALPTGAQSLPFTVVLIGWDPRPLEVQQRAYRAEAQDHEVLYCVESWTVNHRDDVTDIVMIHAAHRETADRKHGIADVGRRCLGPNGESLPMFHTHSDGNCQLSPSDIITVVARDAPFEGVQCGDRYFVWEFSSRLRRLIAA